MSLRRRHGRFLPVSRRGYSLTEMLVVISLLSILLPTTGWMLHSLLKIQFAARHEQLRQQTLSHLDEVFRRDIRLSKAAQCSEDRRELRLTGTGTGAIRYRIDVDSIERHEIGTGESTVHRERFQLPECEVTLVPPDTDQSKIWTLVVRRPAIRLTQSSKNEVLETKFAIRATLDAVRRVRGQPVMP